MMPVGHIQAQLGLSLLMVLPRYCNTFPSGQDRKLLQNDLRSLTGGIAIPLLQKVAWRRSYVRRRLGHRTTHDDGVREREGAVGSM